MRRRRSRNHDEPSSLGIFVAKIAKLFLVLCVLLVVVEILSGLAMNHIRHGRTAAVPTLTDQQLVLLYDTDKPRVVRDIQAEDAKLPEAIYEPLVEYSLPQFSGRYFSVTVDGYRGNGHPQSLNTPGAKVFVFGGSTTFGRGVAGDQTIPAYLETVLREQGKDVQVFNFGVPSWTSTQERIALGRLLTAGAKPDVVVFVDGLGDFQSCHMPDRTAWSERIAEALQMSRRMPFLAELVRRSDAVALGQWLVGHPPAEAPDRGDACSSDADVDRVIQRLDTNRRLISGMATAMGFKAVFVQQPVPTYHYDNTKRPVPVDPDLLAHHMNSAKGYPRLMEMRAAGQLFDTNVLWLAETEPADGNAYVDTIHYSPTFNRTLAETIGQYILTNALLP